MENYDKQGELHKNIGIEIESMVNADQDMREQLLKSNLKRETPNVDIDNTRRMKEIVSEIGWPTISKVGKDVSSGAWLLVQHSDLDVEFQKFCLDLMKQAPEGEVSLHDIAFLEDRVRINSKQPQLYGTQFEQINGKFISRGEIEDEEHIDERRASMGLNTLEERFQEMYKKYPSK